MYKKLSRIEGPAGGRANCARYRRSHKISPVTKVIQLAFLLASQQIEALMEENEPVPRKDRQFIEIDLG